MRRRSSVKERPTPVTADEITSPGRRGSAIKFAKSAIVPPTEEALDIEECEAGPSVADPRTMNNRRVSIKQQINLFHHRRSSFDATAMEQAAAAQAAAEAEASVPTGTAAPASDLVAQEEDVELLASPRTAEALVAEALAEAETTAGGATGVDGYGFGDREPDFVLDGFAFFDFGADIGATFDVGGSLSSNDATARDERAKRWAADSESFERPARQSRLGSGRISRYVENGVAPVDSFSNVEISVELTSALRNKTISEPAALDHDVGTYTCGGMQGGAQKTNQDCACHAQPCAPPPPTRPPATAPRHASARSSRACLCVCVLVCVCARLLPLATAALREPLARHSSSCATVTDGTGTVCRRRCSTRSYMSSRTRMT
jgi:hypothetical protein